MRTPAAGPDPGSPDGQDPGRESSVETEASAPLPEAADPVPGRYLLRSDEEGRYLTSRETPEVKVRLESDLSVTASAARKAPEGTIFLDGAAQGEPFLDHERRVFNLDHHEGVIRRFTLSACEQAMVLVLRGLDLRERPWTVLANQPDLDTVLAIWILLNSVYLREDRPELRKACMPLVRVEGLIDSQGLELMEFSGMSEGVLEQALAQIEELKAIELETLAEEGSEPQGPLESLAAQLAAIDRMVYPPEFFQPLPAVEELALEELSEDRIVVVCRCECGIYEAEPVLKRMYGKRLAVIALEREPGFFTLRQVDTFLPGNLEKAYRALNLSDPSVRSSRSANRWGGSGEIGGSPRNAPTPLEPSEIATACRLAYRRPSWKERLSAIGLSLLLASLPMIAGSVVLALGRGESLLPGLAPDWSQALFATVTLAGAALALFLLEAPRHRGLYGLRPPSDWRWLWLAPAALGAGLLGAWAPELRAAAELAHPPILLALLLLPLAAELIFRGLTQGFLIENLSLTLPDRFFSLSWPTVVSALLFAAWTLPLHLLGAGFDFSRPLLATAVFGSALLLGLILGITRERSESLAAPLLLHYLGAAGAVTLALLRA